MIVWGYTIQIFSLLIGIALGLFFPLIFLFITRKKKPNMFLGLRAQLRILNKYLIAASKTVHELDDTLEEVEKNAAH